MNFCELLEKLDERPEIPGCAVINCEVDKLMMELESDSQAPGCREGFHMHRSLVQERYDSLISSCIHKE